MDLRSPIAVTVAGLGQLGLPVAAALASAGHLVTGVDPQEARRASATLHGLPNVRAELTTSDWKRTQVLVSVLPSDAATAALADQAAAAMPPGAIHLCLGTISVKLAASLSGCHSAAAQHFAACPVFGRPDEAWDRDLTAIFGPAICPSTDWHAMAHAVLGAFAPRRHQVPAPESACAIKLAGNLLIASAISTMAEATRFVQAHGASAVSLHQVITGKLFQGPVYEGVGHRLAHTADRGAASNESPGFTIQLGLKDMNLLCEAAATCGVPVALADPIRRLLNRAVEQGHANADWADLPACH